MLKLFIAKWDTPLVGRWHDIETEKGRIIATRLDDLGYCVTDVDSDWWSDSDTSSIMAFCSSVEMLEDFYEDDAELCKTLVKSGYYDIHEAYNIVNESKASIFICEGVSYTKEEALGYHMEDLGALDFGDESYKGGHAETLKRYFNYEAYGRDLLLGGDYDAIETDDGFIFISNY